MDSIFSEVASAALTLTYAEAKAKVPILFVLEEHNIDYRDNGSGYEFCCPVHDDSSPSCNVFGEKLDVWRCFACGVFGDVTDMVVALQDVKPPVALRWLAQNLEDAEAWAGPREGVERPQVDLEEAQADVLEAANGPYDLINELIAERGWRIDGEWLRNEFGVGEQGGRIVIPYFSDSGSLVTYKTRTPNSKPYSLAGSDFRDVLYGLNRLTSSVPIILTGSESDTWVATWYHGTEYAVVGAPTGETSRPRQAHLLAGRTVYIAFDGDAAGDLGTAKWVDALQREGCQVHIVRIPRGKDVASVGDISELLEDAAETASAAPEGFTVGPTGYFTDKEEISNWTFEPHYVAEGDTGQVFKGVLHPGERNATIQSSDFHGRGSMTKWASAHGKAWYGKDKHAQQLLGALQAAKSHLVKAKSESTIGYHKGAFIWPEGTIGSSGIVFAPGFQHVNYDIKLKQGDWSAQQVADMLGIMGREITTPILAWYAISVLRPLYPEFPMLGVFGVAGSGKTTLLELFGPALTGSKIQLTLTASTEHAIWANLSGTNAFNVHIDELREDVRPETFVRFLQMMRDLYNGKRSEKGNHGNWASTGGQALMAPTVISGETALTEVSHKERVIFVPLNRESAIIGGLDPVWAWEGKYTDGALAYAYLEYVADMMQSNRFAPARTPLHGSIPPRIQNNLGVLRQGWWLLSNFCAQNGVDIGELDLSLVIDKVVGSTGSPLTEALMWAANKQESGVRFEKASGIWTVDIPMFFRTARGGGFAIVGNLESVREQLMNEYQATPKDSKFIVQFTKGIK